MQRYFDYSPEVQAALNAKKPVLALESTLITHGLPYPQNKDLALEVEDIARQMQVTPATIAILKGRIKIGLQKNELEQLINETNNIKASSRDLPYVISKNMSAGTTVAATAFCAHHAGIRVFATGGIGGVHRGDDMDISADLLELTKTPIAVVCSGAKSILDLARTLEFLETFSVPIVGYKTEYLPAFYTAKTSFKLPMTINDFEQMRHFLKVHWQMNPNMGVLIANPIPDNDDIPEHIIEPAISKALAKAAENNIKGKAITPFLLNEIRNITDNKSLTANLSLIRNNVKIGSQIVKVFLNILPSSTLKG